MALLTLILLFVVFAAWKDRRPLKIVLTPEEARAVRARWWEAAKGELQCWAVCAGLGLRSSWRGSCECSLEDHDLCRHRLGESLAVFPARYLVNPRDRGPGLPGVRRRASSLAGSNSILDGLRVRLRYHHSRRSVSLFGLPSVSASFSTATAKEVSS
jgi:hypothetical protein